MSRENLWLVKCTDRDGDDVNDLRQQHMAGHLAHIEAIVDHLAMAGPLKDHAGERIIGSLLAYRTDDLSQAQAWLEADPYARWYLGVGGVDAAGAGCRRPGGWRDLVGARGSTGPFAPPARQATLLISLTAHMASP
ncbi:MAG: YciI family protein [Luminiphilus sp.]|jgi:uncharacterized protein YciI